METYLLQAQSFFKCKDFKSDKKLKMQNSVDWIEKLKNHEYFKSSKSNFFTKNDNIFRNILAFRHGSVYLWDETTLSLLNFQLKNLLTEPNKLFMRVSIF